MIGLLPLLLLAALENQTGEEAFSRYQLILDRKPFGAVAVAGATEPESAVDPSLPPLSSLFRLAALEKDDNSGVIRAGLVESGGKKNYFLRVGEEEDGLKLVEADYKADRVLLRKGAQEEWIGMGGSATKSSTPNAPADPANEIGRRQRFRDMMAARLAQRNAFTNAPPPPRAVVVPTNLPSFKNSAEMDEHYRKINLDLIRSAGKKGPPLPIALTPEDDAQLVKEGVLPPLEPAPAP